jgi:hypothetical protein
VSSRGWLGEVPAAAVRSLCSTLAVCVSALSSTLLPPLFIHYSWRPPRTSRACAGGARREAGRPGRGGAGRRRRPPARPHRRGRPGRREPLARARVWGVGARVRGVRGHERVMGLCAFVCARCRLRVRVRTGRGGSRKKTGQCCCCSTSTNLEKKRKLRSPVQSAHEAVRVGGRERDTHSPPHRSLSCHLPPAAPAPPPRAAAAAAATGPHPRRPHRGVAPLLLAHPSKRATRPPCPSTPRSPPWPWPARSSPCGLS